MQRSLGWLGSSAKTMVRAVPRVVHHVLTYCAARYPVQQRIHDRRAGTGRQKYPFVAWILSLAMLGVMIYELVRNQQEQGTPISLKVSRSQGTKACADFLMAFSRMLILCWDRLHPV